MLEENAFFALEKGNCNIATGLGFGAEPYNIHVKKQMEVYEKSTFYKEDGSLNLKACPVISTEYFEQLGFKREDVIQRIEACTIYPSEYFCPMDFNGNMEKTDNTVGIHWYDATWLDKSDKHIHHIEMKINQRLPKGIASIACKIYRNGYRFIEYIQKGVLIKKILNKITNK